MARRVGGAKDAGENVKEEHHPRASSSRLAHPGCHYPAGESIHLSPAMRSTSARVTILRRKPPTGTLASSPASTIAPTWRPAEGALISPLVPHREMGISRPLSSVNWFDRCKPGPTSNPN